MSKLKQAKGVIFLRHSVDLRITQKSERFHFLRHSVDLRITQHMPIT